MYRVRCVLWHTMYVVRSNTGNKYGLRSTSQRTCLSVDDPWSGSHPRFLHICCCPLLRFTASQLPNPTNAVLRRTRSDLFFFFPLPLLPLLLLPFQLPAHFSLIAYTHQTLRLCFLPESFSTHRSSLNNLPLDDRGFSGRLSHSAPRCRARVSLRLAFPPPLSIGLSITTISSDRFVLKHRSPWTHLAI